MISWGLKEEDADKAIKYLNENHFIDDRRYATYFVRDKLKFNKWGRIKIKYALRQKKVDTSIIEDSISQIDTEIYNDILDKILLSKIKSVGPPDTAQNKSKLLRYAAQKGFTASEIFDSLSRINC